MIVVGFCKLFCWYFWKVASIYFHGPLPEANHLSEVIYNWHAFPNNELAKPQYNVGPYSIALF